jgi:Leucine-rich repeat (LRR) protein
MKIKEKSLEDYFIDKNTSLDRQKELKYLSCYNSELTSLEEIKKLTKLRWLSCHNNKLDSLKGIEHLTNLKTLFCSNNQLISLEGIEHCINLKTLYCNDIIDIQQYKNKIKNIIKIK